MTRIALLVLFLLGSYRTIAQKVGEERLEAMPYYNYGRGLGITSPDSIYKLNIRFRMQNRATYLEEDGKRSIDGQIRRLRLRFDGYVGSPRFTYLFQLSFAPGDVGELEEGKNLNIIRDAVVFFQPNKFWTIAFGQTKLPGNRQRFNSSGGLQLTDRSINNARFNVDRDFGIQVHHLKQRRDRFSFNLKAAITSGEGRNFTANDDVKLAYTAKVEVFPLGGFEKGGEYFEGDLMREEKPRFMTSFAYQFNSGAKQTQGQTGELLPSGKDIRSLFGDFIFKYRGLALMSSYMERTSSRAMLLPGEIIDPMKSVYAGRGMDYQASYLLPSNFEMIGRYSWQNVVPSLQMHLPNHRQYTLGITRYIWEHAFKVQGELTYQTTHLLNQAHQSSWYFRLQTEIGI
jgi:phosphate-selective porin OprO/OprP